MMSNAALIGHSGFVGGHLRRQAHFDAEYNSRTIDGAAGSEFDLVVCAAAPGSMFEANNFPDRDRASVDRLIDQLSQVRARRFVLISSIAVLADFAGGDDEGTTAFQAERAYGRHRRALEAFVEDRFDDRLIVRLPALMGAGLKKNFLFDIANPMPSMLTADAWAAMQAALGDASAGGLGDFYTHDAERDLHILDRAAFDASLRRNAYEQAAQSAGLSAIRFTHPDSSYQFYDMDRLWSDVSIAIGAGLDVVHLAPQPVRAADAYRAITGDVMPATPARIHHEDMRTRHADLWGRDDCYIADAADILGRLSALFPVGDAR